MNERIYFDYLVIGGEHDGRCYNGPLTDCLEVNAIYVPMAKYCSPHIPSEVLVQKKISYNVRHYHRYDGKCFLIATNENPEEDEIEQAITKMQPRPVN